MRRGSSTVVCFAGPPAVADAAGGAANVAVVQTPVPPASTPAEVTSRALEARAVYDRAGARQFPYVLVAADPLAGVRDAWVRRFSGELDREDVLDEFVAATVPAPIELPDYYLVASPPQPTVELEWYAGVVASARRSRVVVVPGSPDVHATAQGIWAALGNLPASPWWPPASEVVERARTVIPAAAAARVGPTQTRRPGADAVRTSPRRQ